MRMVFFSIDTWLLELLVLSTQVVRYRGIWVRQSVLGFGRFLEKNVATKKLRAVKQLMKGTTTWHDREMDCMISVKNVD